MYQNVIETNGLSKAFRRKLAVDGIDLRVRSGEIYGFLGLNGAGKTTTIRMLMGLATPTSGTMRLFGREVPRERMAVMGRVGALVESPSYYAHLSANENLHIVATLLGIEQPRAAIQRALSIVGLSESDAKRRTGQYSLGMKQRLGIAVALVGSPDLLVLDEPTNGLDPAGIQEIRELIRMMPREHGITVLISSHLLAEVDQTATAVGVIHKGRLIFQGPIDDLRARSRAHVLLEVGDVARALPALAERGLPVTPAEGGAVALAAMDPVDAATAVRTLVSEDIAVYRVYEAKRTLEEIFLELTGEEPRAEVAA